MPLPAEKFYTYADFLTWDESEWVELIEGDVFMMSPTPTRFHQEISGEIFLQIGSYLRGKKCKVYAAPFTVRPFEREDDDPRGVDTVVQPDITVVCDPGKLDDMGCKGAPDLIVEILSPSNRRHDMLTKFNLYQRAGVREYWIVDPDARTVSVYTLEEGAYHAAEVYSAGSSVPVGVLEDCSIDLKTVFPDT